MAAANAERTELAKLERFARPFGADGLARMRVFFDEHGMNPEARAEVTPLEKVLLIGCARLWAATAMSGTRGACVVSSDQAPRRARSMGARGSGLFNGVTQNTSLFACSLHFRGRINVTLCISTSLFAFHPAIAIAVCR